MYNAIILDCRELEPPEPLSLVVSNLAKIDDFTYLKIIHRQNPMVLLTLLESNGYKYRSIQKKDEINIYIYSLNEKIGKYICSLG